MSHLRSTVATVNDDVRTGGVAGGVRGKVKVCTLQLVSLALTAHGDLVTPDVLGVFRNKVGDLGSNVSGRDGVGTGEAYPLDGEGLACGDC